MPHEIPLNMGNSEMSTDVVPPTLLVGTAPISAGQEVPKVLTLQEAKNLSVLCLRSFISSRKILHSKVIREGVSQGFCERGAVPSQ